jgi:signal transduction histidine kinase
VNGDKDEPVNPLRPRARIMLTIGSELISSEKVALIELVKNAYDADARHVLVRVRGEAVDHGDRVAIPEGAGVVEVLDDGAGMDRPTIDGIWMEPATASRRKARRSTAGRRVLGEKGVGRFASAKIGSELELVSRVRGGAEVEVRLNWAAFEDDSLYLDQVNIDVDERTAESFVSNGPVHEIWRQAAILYLADSEGRVRSPDSTHGTLLSMSGLRVPWDRSVFDDVRTALARLVSPFGRDEDGVDSDFQIILEGPDELVDSGVVEPPSELSKPHYRLDATVDATGVADLTIALKDGSSQQIEVQLENADEELGALRCGPFSVSLRVWDRDQASMLEMAGERPKVKLVRETIDAAAGVSIYRDGFRVLPYGEAGDDWLGLDLRRVQSPTRRLSNNQIVGFIKIGRDDNPELADQTNREGIVEGNAFADLKHATLQLLRRLEEERYRIRPRKTRSPKGGLLDRIDLGELQAAISARLPGDQQLQQMVVALQVEIDDRTAEVGEALARYHRLATLGQLVDEVVHQLSQPVGATNRTTALALRDIADHDAGNDCDEVLASLSNRLRTIAKQNRVAGDYLRRIEPLGGRRRGRPQTINLVEAVREIIEVSRGELDRYGVVVDLPEGEITVTIDPTELQDVVLNLIRNAVYWVRRVPKGKRRVSVTAARNPDHSVSITVEDSGPGVADEDRDFVFEPYFSRREGGTGLGLSIAGSVVSDYYGGELVLLSSGDLGGARFRATFRRRIGP